jgi:hypothetical protein
MPPKRVFTEPIELFYSYSHLDEKLRIVLEKHLSILKRNNTITGWNFRKIGAGKEWEKQIDEHLRSAKIILLLISANFLDSDYCYDVELKLAMERHEKGDARVIPIILHAVDWKGSPFEKLNALPTNTKPISSWKNRNEAFKDVAVGIRKAVEEITGISTTPKKTQAVKADTLPPIWNVPHLRNPNFTGRDDILDRLRKSLTSGQPAALTQAIHGLGGIGKTQVAVEYAYRHGGEYDLVWWIRSEEPATLASDYAALATPLDLPQKDAKEQPLIIAAVKEWLRTNTKWLLIFDNATDAKSLHEYLPPGGKGHVVITSINHDWKSICKDFKVDVWEPKQSVEFLLKRTGLEDEKSASTLAIALGDLPLALEQAGAYICSASSTFSKYLDLFKKYQTELFDHCPLPSEYTKTVTTTWKISFAEIEQQSPAAADLLRLCSFWAPEDIVVFD